MVNFNTRTNLFWTCGKSGVDRWGEVILEHLPHIPSPESSLGGKIILIRVEVGDPIEVLDILGLEMVSSTT